MTMRRAFSVALAASLIAGCGNNGAGQTGNADEPRIKMANPFHDELQQLAPDLQRIGLMRAIRQTGNRCQRVDNAAYQQEYRNMRMWVAQCGVESKYWTVFIAPNGDVQVRDCAQAGQLALPRCQPPPPAAPSGDNVFREGASDRAFRNEFLK